MKHRISAGVIVERDGRLLMVRHRLPGRYDFWVCPGGGVEGTESLEAAARREALEETGLDVRVGKLLYVEELVNPTQRYIKFWFQGWVEAGELGTQPVKTAGEHIVQVAWLDSRALREAVVFPPVVIDRYWQDRANDLSAPVRLPLRNMDFW